jgi:hypothetical protein
MCTDEEFKEDTSPLVLGPIHKQRWIYACSKQLLDRVIWAYGQEGSCSSPCSGPSTGSAPSWMTRMPPRKGAPGW